MTLSCPKCGKQIPADESEPTGSVVCPACGGLMNGPRRAASAAPVARVVAPAAAAERAPDRHAGLFPSSIWPVIVAVLVGLLLTACVAAVVAWAVRAGAGASGAAVPADDRQLSELLPKIIALKNDAERLAIGGDLVAAHERYRQIEQLVGGRRIKDSALWDLAERAKQDQDRVYDLLLTRLQNELLAQRQAMVQHGPAPPAPQPPEAAYPQDMPLINRPTTLQAPGTMPASARLETRAARGVPLPLTLPATRQVAPDTGPATRAAVPRGRNPAGQLDPAIRRGVDFLLAQFRTDELDLPGITDRTYLEGLNALCVYALLSAGRATGEARLDIRGPVMSRLVKRMKEHLMTEDALHPAAPVTYARSLRAAALSVHNRPEDRQTLAADVNWLIAAATDGAYTYNASYGWRRPIGRGGAEQAPQTVIGGDDEAGMLYYVDPDSGPVTWLHNNESRVPVAGMKRRQFRDYRGLPTPSPTITSYRDARSLLPGPVQPPDLPWDNSNTQYGHFGVWCGAVAGINVPAGYWIEAETHWLNCQLPDGRWFYDPASQQPTASMTLGGIASLLAIHQYLYAGDAGAMSEGNYYAPLAAALAWLEKDDNCLEAIAPPLRYVGYNLFALSRVGQACGYKHFGKHELFAELAARAVASQFPNGAWGRVDHGPDAIIDTAYIVLFLAWGRQPVMINKLRYDGAWNNRPYDVANLVHFASAETERSMRWQVVRADRPWEDWSDSPVLYIAGAQAPRFDDEQLLKLKAYVEHGGVILTHADNGSTAFNDFVARMSRRLFGIVPTALPRGHDIYRINYRLEPRIELRAVTIGSRVVLVHCPADIAAAWQTRDASRQDLFELGVNIAVYAAGKAAFPQPRQQRP